MRPKSILWFERLFILFETAASFLRLRRFPQMMDGFGPIMTFTLFALLLIIPVALALSVSRRRSRVALILLILFTWTLGLAVVIGFVLLGRGSPADLVESLLAAAPMALTLLLFTPTARAWLQSSAPPPVSPEKLKRTFE
ncbi:MAG TPA: hypothetical protein VIT45_05290 [Allosphingosinicella sp.]